MMQNSLPMHSRVWIYQSNRTLSQSEVDRINKEAALFLASWKAHGAQLHAAIEVIYNHFVVISVDEKVALASGCSIDTSVKFMKELQESLQIDFLDRMQIAYKDESGKIQLLALPNFQKAIENGFVNEQTIVFNNLVQSKEEFLSNWEVPLHKSWHQQLMT